MNATPEHPDHRDDSTPSVEPTGLDHGDTETAAVAAQSADRTEAAETSDGATAVPADAPEAEAATTTPVEPVPATQQRAAQHPAPHQPTAAYPTEQYPAPQATPPTAPYGAPAPHAGAHPQGAAFGAAATPAAAGTAAGTGTTKKRSASIPVIAALAVGALIGGASGAGISAAVISANAGSGIVAGSSPQTITVNDADEVNAVTAVAAKSGPSVVTIAVAASAGAGTGSGIILSDDGYVLTNTHVVTLDGAAADGQIEVTTYDGKLFTATIVGTDPTTDLAVIKLDDASGLQPIEWADSSDLNVGDTAIAIGAPLGLANTVTDGIVSALNRSIRIASSAAPEGSGEQAPQDDNQGGDSPFDFWNFGDEPGSGGGGGQQPETTIAIPVVQTDAAINPGNSGGALVDRDGKLIGVNVAIASTGSTDASAQSGSIGVGFAVPSNVAKRVSEELIENGTATHGLLGASVDDADSEDGNVVGALIAEAPVAGGAAETVGLEQGDIVTEFNGIPITSATDLTAQVRALPAGAETTLTYVRGDRTETVDVTLGSLGD